MAAVLVINKFALAAAERRHQGLEALPPSSAVYFALPTFFLARLFCFPIRQTPRGGLANLALHLHVLLLSPGFIPQCVRKCTYHSWDAKMRIANRWQQRDMENSICCHLEAMDIEIFAMDMTKRDNFCVKENKLRKIPFKLGYIK